MLAGGQGRRTAGACQEVLPRRVGRLQAGFGVGATPKSTAASN